MGKKRPYSQAEAPPAIEIEEISPFGPSPSSGGVAPNFYPAFQHQQQQFAAMPYWPSQPMFHPGSSTPNFQMRPTDMSGYQMRPAMHPGMALEYPGFYPQGPTYQAGSGADRIKYLDEVAVRSHQKLLAEPKGFGVSDIVNIMISEVGSNQLGWTTMLQEIPLLKRLSSVEEKINSFITTYVAVHKIATLYELVTELCRQENVHDFEEFGFGYPTRYPLLVTYFSTKNVYEMCKIKKLDVLQHLTRFDTEREGKYNIAGFMTYIANKRGLPSGDCAGIRFQNFGQQIGLLRKAKQNEKVAMQECENMSKKHVKAMVQEFLSSVQTRKIPSHIRFSDSDGEDEDNPPQGYNPCPYPSAREEDSKVHPNECDNLTLSSSKLARFVSDWKDVARSCSNAELLKQMVTRDTKWIMKSFGSFPGLHLLNVATFALRNGSLDNFVDSPDEEGTANGESSGPLAADFDSINAKIIEHFNSYVPEECVKGKEWHSFVKWASLCEKQLSKEISSESGCKTLLEYMMLQFNSLELKGSTLMIRPPRKAAVPRHRVAAFIQQASNANSDSEYSDNVVLRCCKQFRTHNKEDLGLDDSESMYSLRQEHSSSGIFYAEALSAGLEQVQVDTLQKVGRLGNMTSADAIRCLSKAPVLSELQNWSQWGGVFEPQLGPLLDWIEANGPGNGLSVLLTCNGDFIRVDGDPRPDKFLSAIAEGRPVDAVGQLVSLAVLHGGAGNAPKELLKSHSSKGLDILGAVYGGKLRESRVGTKRKAVSCFPGEEEVAVFVLDCLKLAPKEFRLLVAEVLYPAFSTMVQNAPELLLQACRISGDRLVLHSIGLELGILKWIDDYKSSGDFETFDDVPDDGEPPLKKQKLDDDREMVMLEPKVEPNVELEPMAVESSIKLPPNAVEIQTNAVELEPKAVGLELQSDTVQIQPEAASHVEVNQDEEAGKIIEDIRRDEFGLEPGSSTTENDLLSKQHARIGRALHCLSHNLYSEDCHFILELIQNADDNTYSVDVSPALAFIIREERIIVLNNEQGFAAKNIRALCDVGNSTKSGSSAGYIGHKGIGFKSVFRVTDAPEIHSNGFHIKFDISQSTLGFILPTPVGVPAGDSEVRESFTEDASIAKSKTRIDLPFMPSIIESAATKSVSSMFFDLHPNLLLFLHKLRTLVVRDEIINTCRVFQRHDLGRCLVKVTDCGVGETYFVVQHKLPAAVVRPGVLSTELACAFGLKELPDGSYESRPVQQQVFAFLPVRSYGLKFIVQGDFILPSSREEVDRDSAWNQWLLSEIPKLFLQSAASFKTFTGFKTRGQAVTSYMSFVPLDGEVLGFFSSVPRMILSQLRAAPCLPTADSVTWALPCMCLRGWDDDVRRLISDELLRDHLGMVYLDKEVVLSNPLASSLGVPEYGTGILASLMKSVCKKQGALQKLGMIWVRDWLLALHRCILSDKQRDEDWEILRGLSSCSFIPSSSGEFTSLEEGPVWFLNSTATDGAENEDFQNSFLALYAELRTVSPLFLMETSGDGSGDAGIVKHMLRQLGVKVVLAHEIVKAHVLPMMARDDCLQKNSTLVVQYLAYCMLHLQLHKCGTCDMERTDIMNELKQNAVVLTDAGLRRIKQERVHFSEAMKNVVDMKKIVHDTGVEWRELSDGYLRAIPSNLAVVSTNLWRKFFSELGVTDFVHVSASRVRVSDKSGSAWKDEIPGSENAGDWLIEDWQCGEIREMLSVLGGKKPEQCALLLSAFDKMWDDGYEQFAKARYRFETSTSAETGGECTSSFIFELRNFAWIKSSLDGRLLKPEQLFHRCDAVENILGSCGQFAVPEVMSSGLVKALGLRTEVALDDVMNLFQDVEATASLDQMERVYKFLQENLSSRKLRKLFKSKSCIFVPVANVEKRQGPVQGKFLRRDEVTWQDPFNILVKLEEAETEVGEFPGKTLHKHYPGLQSFFVKECAVSEAPSFDDYIGILQQLAAHFSPSKVSTEVLALFTSWSEEIENGEIDGDEILRRKQVVLDNKAAIFPTRKDGWVSLRSKKYVLCWCDDDTLLEEFEDVNGAIQFIEFKKTKKKKAKKVYRFLQALGIAKFSEVVEREVITHQGNEYRELQDIIKWITPYAQRYLLQFQEEAYNTFLGSDQHAQLINLECLVADKVFFRYVIRRKQQNIKSRRRIECDCLLQDNKLHVASSHANDYAAIFLEFSRIFFAGETNNHLANFLHLTLLQAQKSPSEGNLEAVIATSQGIPPLPKGQKPWMAAGTSSAPQAYVGKHQEASTTVNGNMAKVAQQQEAENGNRFQDRDMLQYGGLPNDEQRELTGRQGEMLVYEHLCRKHGGDRVKWVNEAVESGAAYDIVVSGSEEGQRAEFVEVKSTRSSTKDWFELTPNEWDFAKEASNRYTIVRATLMENQKKAHLMTLRDPVRLCQEKSLKLAIILPKQNRK